MTSYLAVDREMVRIAAANSGIVTRGELRSAGVSRRVIDRRISSGMLVPVHRGVFVLGGVPLTVRARYVAALRAAGPSAALSHGSSGAHWGLLPARGGAVHVTVPSARRSRPGLECHVSPLADASVTVREGLRCTTVGRTLVDIAGRHGREATVRAWSSAASRRLIRRAEVEEEVRRCAGSPGVDHVRQLLAVHDAYLVQHTRSELERLALRMLKSRGIPVPAANRLVVVGEEMFEGDLVWGRERIVGELDGRDAHQHALAFEEDRDRDAVLGLAGWRAVRWTHGDLTLHAERTGARIEAALRQRPLDPADGIVARVEERRTPPRP